MTSQKLSTLGTAVLCFITPLRFSFPQTLVSVCNNQSCICLDAYWLASFNWMWPVLSRGICLVSSRLYLQSLGDWLLWGRGPTRVLSATSGSVNMGTADVFVKKDKCHEVQSKGHFQRFPWRRIFHPSCDSNVHPSFRNISLAKSPMFSRIFPS